MVLYTSRPVHLPVCSYHAKGRSQRLVKRCQPSQPLAFQHSLSHCLQGSLQPSPRLQCALQLICTLDSLPTCTSTRFTSLTPQTHPLHNFATASNSQHSKHTGVPAQSHILKMARTCATHACCYAGRMATGRSSWAKLCWMQCRRQVCSHFLLPRFRGIQERLLLMTCWSAFLQMHAGVERRKESGSFRGRGLGVHGS